MDNGPRKASDILLELETKVDILLGIVRSQDLNIKILSNKLNMLTEAKPMMAQAPQIMVEAINVKHNNIVQPLPPEEKQVNVSSEFQIQVEGSPQGFRRTSRPETFSGDNAYLKKPKDIVKTAPAEVTVPDKKVPTNKPAPVPPPTDGASVSVRQRVVDRNGKSVFLADVEITNTNDTTLTYKSRTNSTGNWSSVLPPGQYKIVIKKRETIQKEKLETVQNIIIDGSKPVEELSMIIIK